MSGTLSGALPADTIRERAERLEELAAEYAGDFERYQAAANEWRVELPPEDLEPGPVIDSEFTELGPEL
jgi:hypothetical protein